jgi:hypothetical protein
VARHSNMGAYQHSTQCRIAVRPLELAHQPHRQTCLNKRVATCSRSNSLLEQETVTGPPQSPHLNSRMWAKLRISSIRVSVFSTEADAMSNYSDLFFI